MWAHYAEKHEGFCLEFDSNTLKDNLFTGFYRVEYPESDLRPLINFSPEEWISKDFSRKILTIKSNLWSYEREIRMIKPGKEEYYDFRPNALTKIIFGSETPIRHKEGFRFLIDTLNKEGSLAHIRFIEASLDSKYFKVNVPK